MVKRTKMTFRKKNSFFKGGRVKKKNKNKKDKVKKNKSYGRKRKFSMRISEKHYKELVNKKKNKKRLTKKQKKDLNDALSYKYCKCLHSLEKGGNQKGFPICMNSVYKKRKFDPPFAISLNCKKIFLKK
jgi:hypothetical protein